MLPSRNSSGSGTAPAQPAPCSWDFSSIQSCLFFSWVSARVRVVCVGVRRCITMTFSLIDERKLSVWCWRLRKRKIHPLDISGLRFFQNKFDVPSRKDSDVDVLDGPVNRGRDAPKIGEDCCQGCRRARRKVGCSPPNQHRYFWIFWFRYFVECAVSCRSQSKIPFLPFRRRRNALEVQLVTSLYIYVIFPNNSCGPFLNFH